MENDEVNNMLVRSINDLQIVIKDIGLRLHEIEGRISKLEQFSRIEPKDLY